MFKHRARILLVALVTLLITLSACKDEIPLTEDQPKEVKEAGPIYNTPFLTDEELEDYDSMTVEQIQQFLANHGSYFQQLVEDIDGEVFDPPSVVAAAASEHRINPQVLLTTMEKESSAITRSTRPSDVAMRFLMGCVSPSTARDQIRCAAERFRAYHDRLAEDKATVSGWAVSVPRTTQDGVTVTPATRAVAGQFTYTPYAGVQWDGNQPSVGGVYLFYNFWNEFGFASGGPLVLAASSEEPSVVVTVIPATIPPTSVEGHVELVGHIGGKCNAVALQGEYAYVGVGPRLIILDASNPLHVYLVGKTRPLPGVVRGIFVAGSYAYVASDPGGLRVVDVSTPSNPIEVGSENSHGYAMDVVVKGDYAYVTYYNGLSLIDVSAPSHPMEVGFCVTPGDDATAATVAGGYAYVAAGPAGLRVVDVSTPSSPIEVGTLNTPSEARGVRDVTVAGGYAYVADWDAGLRVVDISTPSNPTEVGFHDTPGYARSVAVVDGYAYVADHYEGLWVVDVSMPSNPKEVNVYNMPWDACSVAVTAGYAYIADCEAGLRVVDVSTPSDLTEVDSYRTPWQVSSITVDGDYAYVADRGAGLRVLNVSTPSSPWEVGSYATPGTAYGVAVAGPYVYVADRETGLRVLNRQSMAEVGFCDISDSACAVAVAGDYAYVVGFWGLRVVDVSNPFDPMEVGVYDRPGHTSAGAGGRNVAVAAGYAYFADWEAGLRILDVSTPSNPMEVGFYPTSGNAYAVAVVGDLAYIASLEGGLRIVDISAPATPVQVGVFETPWYEPIEGVAVTGDYAYVVCGTVGLRVLDVSTPSNPTKVGIYKTPYYAEDVFVSNDYAYVVDAEAGLYILRFTAPR